MVLSINKFGFANFCLVLTTTKLALSWFGFLQVVERQKEEEEEDRRLPWIPHLNSTLICISNITIMDCYFLEKWIDVSWMKKNVTEKSFVADKNAQICFPVGWNARRILTLMAWKMAIYNKNIYRRRVRL